MVSTWQPAGTAPQVSVVMPSLNQCAFLEAAACSALEQGVEGLELVVVDGGSSDGSLERLVSLAERFPGRLRWCSAPDGGPAQAVNRGVEMARGALIGWLNSDDLYAPGAVQRALEHFAANPGHVMAYGHGEHVDAEGRHLEPYPTRPPGTPLAAFADGCHICQPTAFFRRDAFLALGGLDTSLRASFDFDFWLRLFKAHPGRIGFVEALQASTRLHAGTITTRLRGRVALEGLQVIHRHIGPAPGHWLLTHFDELCEHHPFHAEPQDLLAQCRELVEAAQPWVAVETAYALRQCIDADQRLRHATPHFFAAVHADGWAGAVFDVRLWQPAHPYKAIKLACRHAAPNGQPLRLRVAAPSGEARSFEMPGPGPFELNLLVDEPRPDSRLIFRVSCADGFVPAECEPGSQDRRRLAFLLDACHLIPAS